MKKFLSIAAVLVLLLTLTVPTLAAGVNYPSVTNGEIEATSNDGTKVEVDYANPADVNEDGLKVAVSGDYDGIDVFDINALDDAGNKAERNDPIEVTFSYENADLVIGAKIQNNDKSWSDVRFTVNGKFITLYLPHLTPIALILKANDSAPVAPVPQDGGSHQSPFTGDYTVIWAAVAVVMALCAGACFISARKRNAE
jgi:hypothetical protein